MTDKVVGNTRDPQCYECRRPVSIYHSNGMTAEGTPFITPMVRPCAYCMETERLRGAKHQLETLIAERET